MIIENSEYKYAKCGLCGHERECFIQYKSGEEQTICPFCLSMIYCY